MCESFFVISKGPYLLGLSLAVGCIVFRWVASNQTFCPSSKGLYLVALIVICWVCVIACCAACLMISSKGDFPVAALGQALCVYWARGSHLAQSVCAPFPNIRRYCSSHWLVRSDCPSVWGW